MRFLAGATIGLLGGVLLDWACFEIGTETAIVDRGGWMIDTFADTIRTTMTFIAFTNVNIYESLTLTRVY
jgi:hypothetical protein